MIDGDCAAPTFHAAFDLIPVAAMQRPQFDPDRYDIIEVRPSQPVEWIRVRRFEWRQSVDPDSGDGMDVRPMVARKVDEPAPPRYRYRIGSLAGQISIPDDFETMFQAEIEDMFGL